MSTQSWAAVNGVVTPLADARIPVHDRGFLYADSVYEVLRTVGGEPLFWAEHLERLHGSAERIALDFDSAGLLAGCRALAEKMPGEARLRIIVTRGSELDGPRTQVIIATPLGTPASAQFPGGCSLLCVPVPMPGSGPDPHAKTGDRKLAVKAETVARRAGCHEALRIDPAGRVLEGATSTIFAVRDGVLITPPLDVGVLAGITRAKVLAEAERLGIPVRLRTFLRAELPELSELFITSTSRGVVPVNQVDALTYSAPGPITRQLGAAYQALLDACGARAEARRAQPSAPS